MGEHFEKRRRALIEKFVKERGWFVPSLHEKYIAKMEQK
jgi:hypothetical protein